MSRDCVTDAPRTQTKSRLRTLDQLDGRTAACKRARELVAGLESDLGGASEVTVGQRELVKRAALLGAYIEDCEVRWLRNEPVQIDEYLAAINSQRRVLATLGLERRAKDVTDEAATITRQFFEEYRKPNEAV